MRISISVHLFVTGFFAVRAPALTQVDALADAHVSQNVVRREASHQHDVVLLRFSEALLSGQQLTEYVPESFGSSYPLGYPVRSRPYATACHALNRPSTHTLSMMQSSEVTGVSPR